ncbi:MAG: PEGA domain-containing protein [Bacteroidota bacterium]
MALSSCATLLHGSREVLYFNSFPSGATVSINRKEVGTTPLTIKRRRRYIREIVTMKLDGYETDSFRIKRKTIAFSSLLSGALLPIDLLSSAAIRYKDIYWERNLTRTDGQPETFRKNIYEYPYIITTSDDTIWLLGMQNTLRDAYTRNEIHDKDITVTHAATGQRVHMTNVKEARTIGKQEERWGPLFLKKKYSKQYWTYEGGHNVGSHKDADFYRLCDYGNYKLMESYEVETIAVGHNFGRGANTQITATTIYIDLYVMTKDNKLVATINKKNYKQVLDEYFSSNSALQKWVGKSRSYAHFLRIFDPAAVSRESIQDNRKRINQKR